MTQLLVTSDLDNEPLAMPRIKRHDGLKISQHSVRTCKIVSHDGTSGVKYRCVVRLTTEAAFGVGRQRIDLRETLAALPNQVLLVWGTADGVIPVAHAQEATRARQSRLEVFTDCGHCPHIEHSDEFNQLVMSFLGET